MPDEKHQAPIPLAVVGCDFRTASSRWRSRLVLAPEEATELAHSLRRNEAGDGFADLNTCNRTEWIVSTEQPAWVAELLRAQMKQRAGLDEAPWFEPYIHTGEQAAEHILRVAIGLESLVVGERQIAGQLYRALERAREQGTSSRTLNGLGVVSGRLVRAALKRGCLSGAGVGVHGLSLRYLRHRFPGEARLRVLVVGLGSIGRQVSSLLEGQPGIEPVLCNRTVPPERHARVHPLSALPALLDEVDAAIICSGAPEPILAAAELPARSSERPLVVVDIGIPHQVTREGIPAGVTLAGLDELTEFHQESRAVDRLSDEDCEREVAYSLSEFRAVCAEPVYAEILDTVHRQHGHLVKEDLPAAVADLPDELRARVIEELRSGIRGYTTEVLKAIRSQSCHCDDPEDQTRC